MTDIFSLSTLELPITSPFSRDLPKRAIRDKGGLSQVWNNYDRRTLIYDTVHLDHLGVVRLYLPRLLNLARLIDEAEYWIDGKRRQPNKRRRYRRFETIDFNIDASEPKELEIRSQDLGVLQPSINPSHSEVFAGRRVIYTMFRNERLEWIRDWLIFHQKLHGADAVLLADNGSTLYTTQDLCQLLRGVPGYKVQRLLSVPLKWGPTGHVPGADDGKYLQTTMLNLVRDRFLTSAYAVINLDLDELLIARNGHNIFDRTQRWGLVTFPGEWRYAEKDIKVPFHTDHRYRNPADKPCATKYCFRPQSLLGSMCLSVHGLERLSRRFFSGKKDFTFLHCKSISTSWKYDRTKVPDVRMEFDQATAEVLDNTLGPRSSV